MVRLTGAKAVDKNVYDRTVSELIYSPEATFDHRTADIYRGPIGEVNGSTVTDDLGDLNEANALFVG